MLPWEEDPDEGLKTFLLRCACGPPSISRNPADTFMFHGQVMYRHLKEQKLALFTSFGGGKGGISRTCLAVFQGYQARPIWGPGGAVKPFRVWVLPILPTCFGCCCSPISYERQGPQEQPAAMPLWMEPYFNALCRDVKQHNHAEHRVIKAPFEKISSRFLFLRCQRRKRVLAKITGGEN